MRPVVAILVLLLLAPALMPPAASQSGGAVRVLVRGVAGAFGPDVWKEEQPISGNVTSGTPLPTVPNLIGTYRNPYFTGGPRQLPTGPANAWGYSVNLTIELADANGAPIQDAPLNLYIEAAIPTALGTVPAKLTKLGPTSFRATFDFDGEVGKPYPALVAGSAPVVVDVYQQVPAAQPRKLGQETITLRTSYGVGSLPAVAFPREALQVYSDLGNLTTLATRPLTPADSITTSFGFGVPNATAKVLMINNRASKVVFEGRTGASGALSVTAKPADVLGTAQGGLVVLAAFLAGSPTDLNVGSGIVVVPVQSHTTAVTSIQLESRVPRADDPTATVRVGVNDPDATPQVGGRHGRVVALDGVQVLANVPFLPVEPGTTDINHKFARYPAAFVKEAKVSSYTLYTLLFTERNEFYSLATATRGYTISAAPVTVDEGKPGELKLTVRNLNNNGDAQADIGLATTVKLAVKDLPGGGNWTGESALAEGESKILTVPFDARQGSHEATINSTADELTLDRMATIRVVAPKGALDSFLERLVPAPAALALLALAGVAAFAMRRRR